ncbi:MAG: aldo/keto reductase [Gemmatimonadetes bacterium]|nr:aldo/keto reductase [Gemmatimonadota bacterium]
MGDARRVDHGVERIELAPGFSISRVVTGLWQVADMERLGGPVERERAVDALAALVDAGFTAFDMADHYGSAEEIAGALLSREASRHAECLTKWVPPPGRLHQQDVRAAVDRALRRLRARRIDLLQFHTWRYADPSWLDALHWLVELQTEGLIRCIGLTNFDTAHLRIAVESGFPVVSNQVCFSLIDRRPLTGMLELCRSCGIGLLAYGTVAGGLLTERWLGAPRPGSAQTWSQMKYLRFIDAAGGWDAFQRLLRVVERVSKRHGVSMANVACRWVLEQPGVAAIVIGARPGERSHAEENLRLFRFGLDEASRAELDDAAARLEPIPGDCGDEYRRPPFLTAAGDLRDHFDALPPIWETKPGPGGRTVVLTGTVWERAGGFSRALRQGNRIVVSGTTATHGDRVVGGSDPVAQTHFIIDRIEGALASLGGRLDDVIRTRVYVRNVEDWEPVARAHGQRFGRVLPANTLVRADLVGDEYLVEIEAEAVVQDADERAS